MTRMLALLLGLLAAGAALYVLGSRAPLSASRSDAPHGPIDEASRARLEGVLKDEGG